tara:strand:- start:2148 stop:3386 length:1239 start_codon:yes stop_codon:yes gene_type:complete
MKSTPRWLDSLRFTIKTANGHGWSVTEQSGKVKLINRMVEGNSTTILDLPFSASSTQQVLDAIHKLRGLMSSRGLTLAQAGKLVKTGKTGTRVNWPHTAQKFLTTKENHRTSTKKGYALSIKRVLDVFASKPVPTDGYAVMRAYAAKYFTNCPAGGVGRKRNLGDVAKFLRYAVEECGAPEKWYPVRGDKLDNLIGNSDSTSAESLTPPVKDEDLEFLLTSLRADNKPDLYLAVGLVGLFGLRPAELSALRVDDQGILWVGGQVKRNKRTMKNPKPDRFVFPMDLPSMPGEGQRLLKLYQSGLQPLPEAIIGAINSGNLQAIGNAFGKLLRRYKPWRSIVERNPGVTPYSLRHSYPWRGTKSYKLQVPARDLAAMMGHSLKTHHQHYGRWTDQMSALQSITKVTNTRIENYV